MRTIPTGPDLDDGHHLPRNTGPDRQAEGAKIMEMEQAGCLAVAQFRRFRYGALIYGGDDLSGEEWSNRGWRSREGVRYDLVQLCRKLLEII